MVQRQRFPKLIDWDPSHHRDTEIFGAAAVEMICGRFSSSVFKSDVPGKLGGDKNDKNGVRTCGTNGRS